MVMMVNGLYMLLTLLRTRFEDLAPTKLGGLHLVSDLHICRDRNLTKHTNRNNTSNDKDRPVSSQYDYTVFDPPRPYSHYVGLYFYGHKQQPKGIPKSD